MVPRDEKYLETLGSPFVSFYDLLMINTHYNCLDKCKFKPSAAKCENGGFPNPRKCKRCICPSGYGGRLCNKRPRGCGKTLYADYSYNIFEDAVGTGPDTGESEDFRVCHYWIQAPEGKRIEVTLMSFSEGYRSPGCRYAGVEIKTNRDQRMTGYRFCSHEDAGTVLVSESNIVPVITYNRADQSKTVLRYRMGTTFVAVSMT
ncbi:unnamed protein product [Cylicostephanus goldi]|uniref:CUB domain-containing protein n=1 Tax=Cylicostephanus goldi TaxID=71465 RepID=A0A3P6SQ56_CYLGO|nr:unnamed protein product [Cylicostephanus goldi]